MKDTPLIVLAFKVERSSYFEFRKMVKDTNTTMSRYLRELLNDDLSKSPVKYSNVSDSPKETKIIHQ